jgi:hypothetical protein
MTAGRWVGAALVTAALLLPAAGRAQHEGHATKDTMPGMPGMPGMSGMTMPMAGVLGIPHTRLGSGTSWQPEAAPHYGWHFVRGDWSLMVHGVAYAEYIRQLGPRGDDQFGSINWGMLMAMHPLAGGMLHLHGMLSAEPATIGASGYPLLLQSGESYRGEPLHDRQHPHDLFMEVAALYEHEIAQNLALSLYVAPAGEPALGPVAFPHRMSAASDPLAPLGHHWQDATHITYGVVTLGLFSRKWKVEASAFNGREPDEHRTDFELRGLDSYSARLFYNPNVRWSFSASGGHLASPEVLNPDESLWRYGASVMNTRPFGAHGEWSSSLVYGANAVSGESLSSSALIESDLDLDGVNTIFGRAELVQKSAHDIVVADLSAERRYDLGELTLGYSREIVQARGMTLGASALGTLNFVPSSLESVYGSRTPRGFSLFLRLRPDRMHMETQPHQAP